ncbi:MAG: V-type ATP synthase subunit D [Candidatus Asgardarchaeia archaeon]
MSVRGMRIMPTRGFYLEFKKKVKYIEDGYKLLEMKRDELTRQLREDLEQLKIVGHEYEKRAIEIMEEFRKLYALLGENTVDAQAAIIPKTLDIDVLPRSIMGVQVPFLKVKNEPNIKNKISPILAGIVKEYKELLKTLIKLSELEMKIEVVADNLEKTNRMVNALEKIVLPEMRQTLKYIEDLLDEDMLEEFTRIKLVRNVILERRGEK